MDARIRGHDGVLVYLEQHSRTFHRMFAECVFTLHDLHRPSRVRLNRDGFMPMVDGVDVSVAKTIGDMP